MRSKEEMDKFCMYYQLGKCKHENELDCGKKHIYMKKHEIDFLKEKWDRAKTKKKERDRSKSTTRSQSRKPQKSKTGIDYVEINGKKKPWTCMTFLRSGKCDYEARTNNRCDFPHNDQAKYDELSRKLAAE